MSFNRSGERLIEEGLRILMRDLPGVKQQNLKDKNELVILKNLEARILKSSKMSKIYGDRINRRGDELLASQEQIEQTMQKAIDKALKLLTTEKQKLVNVTQVTDEIDSLANSYGSYLEDLEKLTSVPRPSLDLLKSAHSQIKTEIVAAKKIVQSVEGVKCLEALEEMMTGLENCANEMQSHINSFDNLFRKLIDNQQAFKEQQQKLTVLLMIEKNKFKNDNDNFNDSDEGIEYQQNPMSININRTPNQPIPPRIDSRTRTPGSSSSDSGSDSSPSREEKTGSHVKHKLMNNSIFAGSSMYTASDNRKIASIAKSSVKDNRYNFYSTPAIQEQKPNLSKLGKIDPNLDENGRRRFAISWVENYLNSNPKKPPEVRGSDRAMVLYVKAYLDAMHSFAKHNDDKLRYDRDNKEISPSCRKPVEAEVKKMKKFLEQNREEFLSKLKEAPESRCSIM